MLIAVLCTTAAMAQGKFDPKRFITELHQYVMREAGLSTQEAARLFPIYDEMLEKQRTSFDQLRAIHHTKPTNEAQARGLITKADQLEIQLKETEKAYHARMLRVISAIKLSQVLKAERRFHRLTFRRMAGKDNKLYRPST